MSSWFDSWSTDALERAIAAATRFPPEIQAVKTIADMKAALARRKATAEAETHATMLARAEQFDDARMALEALLNSPHPDRYPHKFADQQVRATLGTIASELAQVTKTWTERAADQSARDLANQQPKDKADK